MTSASSYTSTSYKKINKPTLTTSSSSSAKETGKLRANSSSQNKLNTNTSSATKSPQSKNRPSAPKSTATRVSTSSSGKRSESISAINSKNTKATRTPEKTNKSKASTSSTNKSKKSETKVHEITYSLDSEDASLLENTISNPTELKARLKEELKRRKMTDELLDQLQENYDRLLEKHAEAENVIDSLRIGAKLNLEASNPNFYQVREESTKWRSKSVDQCARPVKEQLFLLDLSCFANNLSVIRDK